MPHGAPPAGGSSRPTIPPAGAGVAAAVPSTGYGALELQASGQADASGTARLAFAPVPLNEVWTGTLVTQASASFAVSAGARPLGTWTGSNPFGHVQARGGDVVSLVATGLAPGAVVVVFWLGSVGDANTPPVPPAPQPSAITIVGGTVTANLAAGASVSITGTPAVTLTGTPSVSITGTPSVSIAGAVSIAGTPSVSIAGAVSIAAGQVVQVTNTSGGNLTVAGTVSIGNTPAVSITGTPSVTIASGSVSITGTPAVTLSGTASVQITAGTVGIQNPTGGSPIYVTTSDVLNKAPTVSVAAESDLTFTYGGGALPAAQSFTPNLAAAAAGDLCVVAFFGGIESSGTASFLLNTPAGWTLFSGSTSPYTSGAGTAGASSLVEWAKVLTAGDIAAPPTFTATPTGTNPGSGTTAKVSFLAVALTNAVINNPNLAGVTYQGKITGSSGVYAMGQANLGASFGLAVVAAKPVTPNVTASNATTLFTGPVVSGASFSYQLLVAAKQLPASSAMSVTLANQGAAAVVDELVVTQVT